MRNLHRIWTRPVHLETVIDEMPYLLTYGGEELKKTKL
jgi:stage V sporulation protein R